MDIQLLFAISAPNDDLTFAVVSLLLLFSVNFLGLGILMFQGQQRARAYQQERRDAQQRLEKERCEAEKEAIAETREQIARDLHDNGTYHLRMALAELDQATQQPTLEETRTTLLRAAVLLENHKVALREAALVLKQDPLQHGLANTIQGEADRLRKLDQFGVEARLETTQPTPLDLACQRLVFRIFQESINNIIKHARANRVTITLSCDAREWTLSVADDGVGFCPPQATPGSGGIANLYKRAALLNAVLQLHSKPGEGTRVQLKIPLTNH